MSSLNNSSIALDSLFVVLVASTKALNSLALNSACFLVGLNSGFTNPHSGQISFLLVLLDFLLFAINNPSAEWLIKITIYYRNTLGVRGKEKGFDFDERVCGITSLVVEPCRLAEASQA
jgi:hypothetical protein